MSNCEECGKKAELRPYGEGGKKICFDCAMATPESEKRTEQALKKILGGIEGPALIGGEDGPVPLLDNGKGKA